MGGAHALSDKTPELKKAPVLAAIYATYDRDPEEAKAWWYQVARGGEEFADKAPSMSWISRFQNKERVPSWALSRGSCQDGNLYQGRGLPGTPIAMAKRRDRENQLRHEEGLLRSRLKEIAQDPKLGDKKM